MDYNPVDDLPAFHLRRPEDHDGAISLRDLAGIILVVVLFYSVFIGIGVVIGWMMWGR